MKPRNSSDRLELKKNPASGFTMVEVLITSVMVALVSLALYSGLSNGINAWQRANTPLFDEDVSIFFDRFFRDVTNSFSFQNMLFVGNETTFSFPTIVRGAQPDGESLGSIGRCEYSFNASSGALERALWTFSDVYSDGPGVRVPLVPSVSAASFAYYFFDRESGEYVWSKDWPPEEGEPKDGAMPLAVRVTFSCQQDGNTVDYAKTVSLPMAGQ